MVVADGVRSPLGKVLGREWHRDTVYGVAGRSYVASGMSDDPWISSHLELRGQDGAVLSGYGWIFPLGTGEVNLGVGTLATAKRPADVAIKPLMSFYADQRREDFQLSGELRMPTMILAGRYDRALCPKYQLDFIRAAPQAEFRWMERSGTFSHIEEAEAVYREAVERAPGFANAHGNLGNLLVAKGRLAEGEVEWSYELFVRRVRLADQERHYDA